MVKTFQCRSTVTKMIILTLSSKIESGISVEFCLTHKMSNKLLRIFTQDNRYKLDTLVIEYLEMNKDKNPNFSKLLDINKARENREEITKPYYNSTDYIRGNNYNNAFVRNRIIGTLLYGMQTSFL